MKTLVVFSSLFCVTLCYPWGLPKPVQDTPEVAAAKSKHLAAHAKARYSTSSLEAQDRSWDNSDHDDGSWKDDTNDGSWKDDGSWKHYDDGSWKHHDDGSWKDDTYASSWKDDGSWKNHDDGSWNNHADSSWEQHNDGSWKDDTIKSWDHHSAGSHYGNDEKKWAGPVALPPGYDKHGAPLPVLDTPEVAAEKSKHFHLYAHAASFAAPPHSSHF